MSKGCCTAQLGLSKQLPPSCTGPRLPLGALTGLPPSAQLKHSWNKSSVSHQHRGSPDTLRASWQGSGTAEHWELLLQAEVKSPGLWCTAAVLGWQYFYYVLVWFLMSLRTSGVCIKGYSVWVLKHQHSIEQNILVRMNLCKTCAVPNLQRMSISQDLSHSRAHPFAPQLWMLMFQCLSTCAFIFHMGRQMACSSKGWEDIQGKNIPLDIKG